MKKLFLFFFIFFSLLFLVFSFLVFFRDLEHISLKKKNYLKQFNSLRKHFNQNVVAVEKSIHTHFLNNQYNINLIESIIKDKIKNKDTINFSKSDYLINFSIQSEKNQILYQIEPGRKPPSIRNYKGNKFIDKESFHFQIPFEVENQSFFLIFEFNTAYFLEQALSQSKAYHADLILNFPKLSILNVYEKNIIKQEVDKQEIENRISACSSLKRICDMYFPNLQKRLLLDQESYFNYSAGFLYTSNPWDIPSISIIVFIILIFFIALNTILLLIISSRSNIPHPIKEIISQTDDQEYEELELGEKGTDQKLTQSQILEIDQDIKIDPDEIPDLSEVSDEETVVDETGDSSEDIPEVEEKIYSQASQDKINKKTDEEISELHKEINQPPKPELNEEPADISIDQRPAEVIQRNILENLNNPSAKQELKNFCYRLVKTIFPKQNFDETERLLEQSPYFSSLLLLKLEGNTFKCEKGIASDIETMSKFLIYDDDYIVTHYLNNKKGILFTKNKQNLSIIGSWFSKKEMEKIELIFIFSLNYNEKKYIFIQY